MSPGVWWAVATSLIVLGVLGTFIPGIPGPVAVFAGMLLAAWIDHFSRVGWVALVVLGALTAAALAIDTLASVLGARQVGASRAALMGALIGTIVGLFFGFVGILIAPFVGAVIGELSSRQHLPSAVRVGVGTWIGLAVGAFAKIVIVLAMLTLFLIDYFFGRTAAR
ncbi:MAG TPA: DUF456 family protein [Steroidobacteraceae bacterium]|jgi:uncharacterized protein YqgC (DUF456 family)|nr:DUF456 family protein [Steroidobacteraceae bacterium]